MWNFFENEKAEYIIHNKFLKNMPQVIHVWNLKIFKRNSDGNTNSTRKWRQIIRQIWKIKNKIESVCSQQRSTDKVFVGQDIIKINKKL